MEFKVVVETKRFLLREFELSDVDGLFELDSDPEVHKFLGNNPVKDKQQIVDVINFIRQQYSDNGIGRWAIIDKSSASFLGWSGLKLVKEITNDHQNYYDIGYRIIRKHWCKGIASETAIASLDYAFAKLNANKVFAAASCENTASNKILQKIGMKFVNTFFYENEKCNWYRISPNEKSIS